MRNFFSVRIEKLGYWWSSWEIKNYRNSLAYWWICIDGILKMIVVLWLSLHQMWNFIVWNFFFFSFFWNLTFCQILICMKIGVKNSPEELVSEQVSTTIWIYTVVFTLLYCSFRSFLIKTFELCQFHFQHISTSFPLLFSPFLLSLR